MLRAVRASAWQLRYVLALALAAIVFDMATTYLAFGRGDVEGNPILAPLFAVGFGPWAVKLAALPLIVLIAAPFTASERRILAGVVCIGAAGLVGIGIHNLAT